MPIPELIYFLLKLIVTLMRTLPCEQRAAGSGAGRGGRVFPGLWGVGPRLGILFGPRTADGSLATRGHYPSRFRSCGGCLGPRRVGSSSGWPLGTQQDFSVQGQAGCWSPRGHLSGPLARASACLLLPTSLFNAWLTASRGCSRQ